MTVLAQTAEFGFGPQTAKGTLATTWYRYRVLSTTPGPTEDNRLSPPEIGGSPFPTGAQKHGAFYAGDTVLQPRLEGDIGWLLYAACGAVSTDADTPESGLYRHTFRPDPSAEEAMKWISVRTLIPGAEGAATSDLGVVGKDVRVARLRIAVPQSGTPTFATSFMGREPSFDDAPSDWTWADAYENSFTSVPLAAKGHFELPDGTEKPALGATVDILNAFTTPRQEMVIGSYYPDDFVILGRSLVVSFVYKWENPDLYKQILANAQTGDGLEAIAWSPVTYDSTFDLTVESAANVSGMSNPYSLRLYAPSVHWQADPISLAAGDMLIMRFTGTALESSGNDYFHLQLTNEVASYTWPS